MKRITLWIALLIFVSGILVTLGYDRAHSVLTADNGRTVEQSKLTGEMELKFIRFISNQYHAYAQYRVTNGSSETVRYPGYATNSNCVLFIKQEGWVKPAEDIQTGNNFGTQSLLSGQTFISDVQIPDGKGAFEIGFAYEVGKEHVWKIAWSEKIEPPAKPTKTF